MNHLANKNVTLSQRLEMADLALKFANAMIEQEIACFHNTRKHTAEDNSKELLKAAQDSIDTVFNIKREMHDLAFQISVAII
jgi:hypothetical protein